MPIERCSTAARQAARQEVLGSCTNDVPWFLDIVPQLFVPGSLTLRVPGDICPRFQREEGKRRIGVPRLRACTSLSSGRFQNCQLPDSRPLSPEKGHAVRSRPWLCEPALPTQRQDMRGCGDDGEPGVIIGSLEALGDTYTLSGTSFQTAFT